MKNTNLLRNKIIFTIFALIFCRIGSFIPIPIVDIDKISFFSEFSKKGIFSIFNTFSGGSISRASIFSLGIMPYISASIIVQLFSSTSPEWKKMKKENPDLMKKKTSSMTRYLALVVALFQSFGILALISRSNLLSETGTYQTLLGILSMTAGTFILIWIADRVSVQGIGNGTSLVIFTGIVAEVPKDFSNLLSTLNSGIITSFEFISIFLMFFALSAIIIIVERSNRLVHIQYPHQVQQMSQHQKHKLPSFMPLKVNPAGVIPPIFAASIMSLPITIASFIDLSSSNKYIQYFTENLNHGTLLFIAINSLLILFFSFFYNSIALDPKEVADQLRKANVFIPGVRPGDSTAAVFSSIIKRLSVIGGLYLILLTALPEVFVKKYGASFFLGGTGVLIVINVIIDTMTSVQISMLPDKYQKNIKKYK